MKDEDLKLKLIYVLKIGYNSKGEGLYEFIFSENPENIDVEGWCWDISPACDNALPPTEKYVKAIYGLKTNTFDLFCLHEAVDREYMHGYHTIHALAYEIDKQVDENSGSGFGDYEKMFEKEEDDDLPLLVFHYGITLEKVKEILETRKIVLKNNEFIEVSSIRF
jgi:hypothetical protein